MSVVAGEEGNMKQPPGEVKRRNTGRRKNNAGGYRAANREQGKEEDWPTCSPVHSQTHLHNVGQVHQVRSPVTQEEFRLHLGTYSVIIHGCGHVYSGQTGCSIQIRVKEQNQHIWFGQTNELVEGEYQFTHNHNVQLQSTTILSITPSYMQQMESIQTI